MAINEREQIEAINVAIKELGLVSRFVTQALIRALPDLLRVNEIPERIVPVRYNEDDSCLLVATNFRLFLLGEGGFSQKPKLFWGSDWVTITSIEYSAGRVWHRIDVRKGWRKKSFYNRWWDDDGRYSTRKLAEYLLSKTGGGKPITKDRQMALVHEVEDAARDPKNPDVAINMLTAVTELKRLPGVLVEGELPAHLTTATYDDRNGLMVSKAMNRHGLLVATDRRLIFIEKRLFGLCKVESFPYTEISSVDLSSGIFSDKMSFSFSGRIEVFQANKQVIRSMTSHLTEMTS